MRRIVVINPVEPAPLSMRAPQGLDLRLDIEFRDIAGTTLDPSTINAQLVLRPRSGGATQVYAMTPVTGYATLTVPGTSLRDPLGYNVEVYQTGTPVAPLTDPVQTDLLARGNLAIRVATYIYTGGALV